MKSFKRAVALVCALLFMMMAVPVSAAAEATVSIPKVTASAGDTIEVPVNVTLISEAVSIGLHVWYDPAVLKCVDAKMSDTVKKMNMADVNTAPLSHPNEVWLTAVNLKPVVLEGAVMTITFEVLATAPAGDSPVKVLTEGLSISVRENLREITVDTIDGAVTVRGDNATHKTDDSVSDEGNDVGEAVKPTTTKATTTTATAQAVDAATTTQATALTPVGETVELTEETVLDLGGNVVTDAHGEPSKVQAIAVMIDSATAMPGDVVSVQVSLSAITDLTAIGIGVRYDTDVLAFEGGEFAGFAKDFPGMSAINEATAGVVEISAIGANGISGSGAIATLRFKVKNTAKNGEYRLSVTEDLLMQDGELELPVKAVAGKITVEGASENGAVGLYAAIAIVAVAAVAAVIVWLCVRRKKAKPAPKKTAPAVVNVSGEED